MSKVHVEHGAREHILIESVESLIAGARGDRVSTLVLERELQIHCD
ncbi:hypothetical protein GRI40_06115 [Altererythrobacter aerius]|uniref:Uncharacterized protein n=1 Tax=Tsuneonella aeria TaxID=1837929 RepID=A0A6I4TDC2_9SPHN|nr:hypothetical protein [Tsuneonella aeria]